MTRYPRAITINNTCVCNARCTMCPTKYAKGRTDPMPMDLFRRIAAQIRPFAPDVQEIHLGVHGEPFADKHLEDRVEICAAEGLPQTVITTNGSLLNEKRAARLLGAGPMSVVFSFESLQAEVYERIRVGLRHKAVLKNILSFLSLRNKLCARTRIVLRFIQSSENEGEYEAYANFWRSRLDPALDGIHYCTMHDWAFGSQAVEGSGLDYGNTPCPQALEQMTILSDGQVALCCLDYDGQYHFGNLNETGLLEVYNSQQFDSVRAMHTNGLRSQLKMCCRCHLPEFWKGDRRYAGLIASFDASVFKVGQ